MRARLSLRAIRYPSETARRGYLIRLQRETKFAHPFAECDTVDNSLTLGQSFLDCLPSACISSASRATSQRYGYQEAETERGPSFPRPLSVGEDFPTRHRSRPFMPENWQVGATTHLLRLLLDPDEKLQRVEPDSSASHYFCCYPSLWRGTCGSDMHAVAVCMWLALHAASPHVVPNGGQLHRRTSHSLVGAHSGRPKPCCLRSGSRPTLFYGQRRGWMVEYGWG